MGHRALWTVVIAVVVAGWGQQSEVGRHPSTAQAREADMKALQAARTAEPAVADVMLRNLVRTAHEDVATLAFLVLKRRGALNVDTLAMALIPDLSEPNMRHVLGVATSSRNAQLRTDWARAALNRIASGQTQKPNAPYEEGGRGTAGLAAMLLVDGGKADRDLIAKVARTRPNDSGLWLALAKLGISSPDDLSLALSVMRDAKAPRWARLAVAALLAPVDSTAKDYVNGALTFFLRSFGQTSVEMIVAEAMRRPAQNPDPAKSAEFQPGLMMLGILEFMQTPDAERITFEFLNAPNLWVRTALGLVAAMRWPERFLPQSSSMQNEERTKLLAALSVFHPEFLSRVQSVVPDQKLSAIRTQMMKDGIETAFNLPGAGLVF
jgi:hypothetical protein